MPPVPAHDQLDDYSRFALTRILDRFPDWKDRVRYELATSEAHQCVVIEIDAPSSTAESGLFVGTDQDELTVGFHTYHCHFTNYDDPQNSQSLDAGLDFASNLLNERCGVVTSYVGNKWAGSVWISLPHPEALTPVSPATTRMTLRSWRGTFDRDEVITHTAAQ